MYQVVITEEKCSNCGECSKICPKGVFSDKDDRVSVSDTFYCTGCEACTAVCPMKAVRVEER